MTAELEDFLQNAFQLRKALQQVLPSEAVNYILELISKDGAHRNYLRIVGESENDTSV